MTCLPYPMHIMHNRRGQLQYYACWRQFDLKSPVPLQAARSGIRPLVLWQVRYGIFSVATVRLVPASAAHRRRCLISRVALRESRIDLARLWSSSFRLLHHNTHAHTESININKHAPHAGERPRRQPRTVVHSSRVISPDTCSSPHG